MADNDRPGLRWPLWSWRNLAVTCVAALGLLFAVGQAMATTPSSGPAHPRRDASSNTAVPAARPPSTEQVQGGDPELPAALPSPTGSSAVAGFLTAWIRPAGAATISELSPHVTPRMLGLLGSGGVAQLPITRVYGTPVLRAHTPSSQVFTVTTDAGRLAVTVARVDGGWLVDQVAVEDTVPTAPTPSVGATRGGA